ncbi:baculoviral IAP repeat-containing protein 7-A-like isoform X2 [Saccostrea cucullata]
MAEHLQSEAAQEVLQEGFKPRIIAKAIEKILQKTGEKNIFKDIILHEIEQMIKNGEIKEESCKIPSTCNIDDILNKNSTSDVHTLQEDVTQLKRCLYCCVCLTRKSEYVLEGCGHLFCQNCFPRSVRLCPVCDQQIIECHGIKHTKLSDLKQDE